MRSIEELTGWTGQTGQLESDLKLRSASKRSFFDFLLRSSQGCYNQRKVRENIFFLKVRSFALDQVNSKLLLKVG